jgi:peptidoglycan hydrolase CwlO-like protein
MTPTELNKAWESAKRLLGLNPKAMHRQERNNVETFFDELSNILGLDEAEEADRLQGLVDSQADDIEELNFRIGEKEAEIKDLKEQITEGDFVE